MGVEPFLVGSSLVAVLAQRLVRVLCTDCREGYTASAEELRELGVRIPDKPLRVFRAKGCAGCNYTGYYGRRGIFELMLVTDEIRALVTQNIDSKTIKQTATRSGMRTLRGDGALKVLQGHTSVAEVLRATEEEGNVIQS
jgi:general secretion pathway protein E